jgi:hypothetical protein
MQLRTGLASLAALALTTVSFAGPLVAQPPRPSPGATLTQTVGVTEITLKYSRPGVKGRQIWGGLVPYDQVWRTGANEPTLFTLSTDAQVDGKPLAAGTYALYTVPGKESWTVIFNRSGADWEVGERKAEDEVLQIAVTPREGAAVERMQFSIPELDDDSAVVQLAWEKLVVPFTVTVDTPRLGLAAAERALAAADAAPGTFATWARWAYDQNLALDQAVTWAGRAVQGDGAESYGSASLHARLLARAGKAAEARAEATRALALITESTPAFWKEDAERLRGEVAAWPK